MPLDQRKRLEHGIMDVRGHLGALLRTDALTALGRKLLDESPRPGSEDKEESDKDDRHRHKAIASGLKGVVRCRECSDSRDQEACAEHKAHDRGDIWTP